MKKIFTLCVLFLCAGALFSQPKKLVFDFDYATYHYDSVSNYIEFYYSFSQNSLTAVKKDAGYVVEAMLKIELQDTLTKNYVVNKEWRVPNPIADSAELKTGKSLIGVISFIVPYGAYKCIVSGKDFNRQESIVQYSENITTRKDFAKETAISDIQLGSNIRQEGADKNSLFYKNSIEITPIPTSVFGANQPVVYYYAEMYNLKKDTTSAELKVNTTVFNSRQKVVYNKVKTIKRMNEARVEIGTLNVSKYPSDTYSLYIRVIDTVTNKTASSSKRFFVYNPNVVDSSQLLTHDKGLISSEFGVMSAEECDDLFEKCKYIAVPEERNQYKKIKELEGKRQFMFDFWKKRDTEPETPKNEFYVEYLNRVQQSNDKFGSLSKIGWKTDRGRVLITYGEPNEIERYPNQVDSKPYEVWQYNNIEGGVVFVFADLTGFSDYILLHSTMRGELRDDTWERRVKSL